MARAFAKLFYKSKEWQEVREGVLMRDLYLCRHCQAPAEEVHHIVHLTPENIYDVNVSLNPDNLVSLCRSCHFKEHYSDKNRSRRKVQIEEPQYMFDDDGNMIIADSPH